MSNDDKSQQGDQQKVKLYKINKRPRDALSDDEDEEQQMNNEYKNDNEATNIMSILFWMEIDSPHYIGYFGQQSYAYAEPNDVIVAYNYSNMDLDWFLWSLKINNLSPTQFLWVQGNNKPQPQDLEKDEYVLKQISLIIEQKSNGDPTLQIRLKPFWMKQTAHNIIKKIKSNVSIKDENMIEKNVIPFGDSLEWGQKFGNKSCLHRYISTPDKPSLFEEYNVYSQIDGLSECKGYICQNKDELLRAYDKLTKEIGRNRVVIKDAFGVGGDDITFYKSKQEIIDNFEWKDEFKFMEMEEDLRYNDHEVEKVEWVGISFYDGKVIGGGHEQIIVDHAVFDGSNAYKNKEIEDQLKRITTKVIAKIGAKYMGGFDFAVQKFKDKKIKAKIYLIDMNTARYTGTTQTFIVMEKFGIKDRYFIRKTLHIHKNACFKTMLNENKDLLFDIESKRGTYFHMFGPNCGDAIISIFGNDEQDANDILNKLRSIKTLCP